MQAATLPCLRIELDPCDWARRTVRNPVEEKMKCSKILVITVPLLLCFVLPGVAQLQKGTQAGDGPLLQELVGLERSALAMDALEAAIAARKPQPGLVHHSDRGI